VQIECIQGHVVDFGTSRKHEGDWFSMVILVTYNVKRKDRTKLSSCRVSEILVLMYAKSHFFDNLPLFQTKIQGVSFGVDPRCWGLHIAKTSGYPQVKLFSYNSNLWSQNPPTTTNPPDRRTDDLSWDI